MGKLCISEISALRFLSENGGGFTAGTIAHNAGHGGSRSRMAVFRTMELAHLFKLELIDKIDTERPAVYVITDVGRAALAAELRR